MFLLGLTSRFPHLNRNNGMGHRTKKVGTGYRIHPQSVKLAARTWLASPRLQLRAGFELGFSNCCLTASSPEGGTSVYWKTSVRSWVFLGWHHFVLHPLVLWVSDCFMGLNSWCFQPKFRVVVPTAPLLVLFSSITCSDAAPHISISSCLDVRSCL